MVQTHVTRFLSESQTDIQNGDNNTDDSRVAPGLASQYEMRTSKKSKNQIIMEKKQARKCDKFLHNSGKKGTPVPKSDISECIDD